MKKRRLSLFLLVSLLVMVVTLLSAGLVACNKKQQPPAPQSGDEVGTYYYDAGMEEYTVVLSEGCQFSMSIFDATKGGSYSLGDDGALTLKPNKEDNQISATLKDNVITLSYNDAEFRFLKKVNYTVKFESNEGSAVSDATVVNGKKVVKPADPSKNGFMFVGWYEDAEFSKPFSFNSYVVTKDTTLYARWVEKQVGKSEFVVEFNAGSGVENPEPKTTVGGRLFDLPVVTREGYTFKGWWYSMSGNDKLTYEFTDGMSLDANSTLIAVWQSNNLGSKLAEPLVSVESNNIKWASVGAKEYILKVQGPDGNYIVNEALITTARSLNFENHPAGDYTVTLTAVASSEENNAVCTRVYRNKALTRVSQFSVIEPSTLLFNAVENAEKYLITIDCGDKNHNHVNFDNGLSTNFNFADCAMHEDGITQKGGIKFTVTAVANGFASSVSQKFVYAPKLDAVTEFSLDAGTQVLTWNKVTNATGYMVSVKCGNSAHSEEFVNVGAVNSIGLKECSSVAGGIAVKVYPVSKWYISPEAATYTFDKQNLATPQNIRINGTVVSWDAVSGAESYTVMVAGKSFTTTTNSVDVAGAELAEKEYYTLSVVAKASGAKDSLATDLIDARNLAMAETLRYEGSVLSWMHVFGAVSYDVQVNDGDVFSVSGGANFANIELTQAGENVLKVRFVGDDSTAYEWVSMSVYAHTLTFVSDGGSSVEEQFKAVGDLIVLPEPEKVGYEFLAWYNTPKGPESNGAAFKELTFTNRGDLVLYACYTSKKYTVTYHYGEGGNASATSDGVYYQKNYKLTVPQVSDATSAFGGWFSAPNGNGVQFTDDKGNSLNPWSKADNADAYAYYFDDVLSYTLIESSSGRSTYAVMKGSRIDQVSEVTIPQTYKGVKVDRIAGNAFNGCSNLVTINVPNTIETISEVNTFSGCVNLCAVNVYEVEGNNSYRYWSADGVLFDNGQASQSQAKAKLSFMPLGKTGSYTIPNGIAEIPAHAFENCALTRVVIPSSVTTIGMEAFKNSLKLETVVFDTGSTNPLTIGDSAFKDCKALETVSLPARLSSIALTKYELLSSSGTPAAQTVSTDTGVTNAFVGCKNLDNVYIASGNKNYKSIDGIIYDANDVLLYCLPTVRGALVISDSVTGIASGAFIGSRITEVTISGTVTSIGECAFYDTDIEKVTFLNDGFADVTIGKYAFRDCDDLAEIEFKKGNHIKEIGEGAFYGCNELEELELPANLEVVGAQAFRDCTSIETVTISSTKASLEFGTDVFYNCTRLKTLSLPKNVTKLPGVFGGCTSLREVIVDPENTHFMSEDGVLFDKAQTVILFYPSNKTNGEYVLPETITTISDGIFSGNRNIKTITFGKNVSHIGAGAFKNCTNLRELIFEEGEGSAATLEIGANAFDGCSSSYFESIVLPARTTKVGDSAFANMSYLKYVTLNEGLTEISSNMFYNDTRLYDITIPASVTSIGESAFYRCGYMPDSFAITFAENSQLKRIEPCAFESVYTSSTGKTVEIPEGVTYIGYKAFYSANFQNVTIPSTVTFIGAEAFASSGSYSASLRSVTFASNGTQDLILGGLDSRYINNGNTLTASPRPYEGRVFYNQSKLTSLELPERLTFIGDETFYNCEGLESISFGKNSNLKHIGEKAFQYVGVQELTIPKSVSNGNVTVDASGNQQFRIGIGARAFYGMKNVEVISFEDGGTLPLSFGDAVFYYLNNLTTVNLPSRVADYVDADGNKVRGLTERVFANITSDGKSQGQEYSNIEAINIAAGGLYYCSIDGVVYTADKSILVICPMGKTGKVTVDSHVALIEARAFKSSKASSIEFEGGTVDMVIGESAFASAKLIEEIVLSDNVVEIKDEAFAYCDGLMSVTLSKNLKEFNSNMFKGTSMPVIITEGSDGFIKKDGVVFSKDMKTLVLYAATLDSESYTVPNGVTEIGANAFKSNSSLKTLILPDGLKEIGDSAFYGAVLLNNIEIPNTVERIGEYAFSGCSSLGTVSFKKGGTQMLVLEKYAFSQSNITSMVLPSRLSSIGSYAFYGCSALESLTFEANSKLDSIDTFAFWNCRSLETLELPGVNKLGDRVFYGCTGLVSVTIAEGLNSIGEYVFAGCANLESVSFPASLHTMGVGAFGYPSNSAYCTSLKSVTFAKGSLLEMIPVNTFTGCTALERITIPASVKSIQGRPQDGDYASSTLLGAFQNCTALTLVAFEDGSKIEKIGAYTFAKCESLSSFTIPSTVSVLDERAFTGCSSLKEITIPSTTTVYGRYLFENCSSLTKVVLSEKATTLPNGMFMNCSSLKQIEIPDSVSSFGSSLFCNTGFETFTVPEKITALPDSFLSRSKITSVVLPDGLTSIGRSSFSDCANLKSIVIPDGVTMIDSGAFENCTSLASVTLSAQLETIGSSAFRSCSSLTSITIPSNVRLIDYRAFDGCVKLVEVFDLSGLKLEEGINTTANGYVAGYAVKVLKQGEESILQYTKDGFVLIAVDEKVGDATVSKLMVLGYNGSASKITLPSDAVGLYDMAFVGALFTEVTIPASFTEIANGAFMDCANLQKVEIKGELVTIGDNAFQNCTSLTSINIPNSVKTIGKYAFDKCAGLTSLSLPTSLTTLGLYAFQDCSGITGDIVIPNAVTRIEGSVFKNCSGITSVKLPSSMSYLGTYAFDGCTALTAFEMDGGQNDYFKVHEGALINLNEYGKVRLKYVPLAKTGTFTVPADVTFTSSDGSIFVGSHLDVLMLEARTNKISEYGTFYTAWLGNATVKAVVISADAFSRLPNDAFKTWTSEQTIYFVQSESEISAIWSGPTNATVVYDYVVPGTETEEEVTPEE